MRKSASEKWIFISSVRLILVNSLEFKKSYKTTAHVPAKCKYKFATHCENKSGIADIMWPGNKRLKSNLSKTSCIILISPLCICKKVLSIQNVSKERELLSWENGTDSL